MAARKPPQPEQQNIQPSPSFPPPYPSKPRAFVQAFLHTYDPAIEPVADSLVAQCPEPVYEQIAALFDKNLSAPTATIPELERLLTVYPQVAPLYTYLTNAYLEAGATARAEALIRLYYSRHPHELSAKINYADLCLRQGESDKIPEIFSYTCELRQICPQRQRFTRAECVGFAGVLCRYYHTLGERRTAIVYYRLLKRLAPRHPITRQARRLLYPPYFVRLLQVVAARLRASSQTARRSNGKVASD
jgi:tetratricopeptide (TPR) repeat protein